MVTLAEMGAEPLPQIWQELRSLRSQKIGAAARGDRRETFDAALEQAEQLFTAAAGVGTATQPLLLFYGLSQLGRAIAASAPELSTKDKKYLLVGHGIDDGRQLQGAATVGLANQMIRGEETGAFPTVAMALHASSMRKAVPLGDLWGLLPYSERFPLPQNGRLTRLELRPSQGWGHDDRVEYVDLTGLPAELKIEVDDPNVVDEAVVRQEWASLVAFLDRYPTLQGGKVTHSEMQRPPLAADGSKLSIPMGFSRADGDRQEAPERAPAYHGAQYVYPRLDDGHLPAHPFMLWWAVLYPLSRLARYYPNVWAKLTAISVNPQAAPIEFILREGLRAVPEIALRALRRAS
ncbi:YaaC family protein [Sinomonas albida]|uniref:YaaC family protein n=1 Tax=Sinomonas albida TaxID=369942 RepID=UPI003017C4C2